MSRKWLPKAPAGMPGVWHTVLGFLPTRSGAYYPNNTWATTVTPALASPGSSLRAWCAHLPSDSVVGYVGTTTKLYTYDGASTFSDKSRGGGYTSTATDWSFCQFGNITLAVNKTDAMQSRDASGAGAFADLAGAPKARILVTQAQQVLAFDIDDGTDRPDAFATCAPGDYTDWSGAGATTATHIRHRPGKVVAAIAFRDYVLAFKRSSVYKITYTGSGTYKWRVECIAVGRGCWGKHDVVSTGDSVVFSGPGGAWVFDGASFRSITDFFGEVPISKGSFFAPLSQNVFFITNTSSNDGYVYNLVSDRWGRLQVEFTHGEAVPMTGDHSALSTFVSPTADKPDVYMLVGLNLATGKVSKCTTFYGAGPADTAYIVSGVEGIGGDTITAFGRVVPDFSWTQSVSSAAAVPADTELVLNVYAGNSKDAASLNFSTATPVISAKASSTPQRRFDILHNAVYARFEFEAVATSGYFELMDFSVKMTPAGTL